jgi:ABC-2 type transport system permease protein
MDGGHAQMGIVIPPNFGARVQSGTAQALLLVDGSNLFTSQSAYNAATAIADAHAAKLLVERLRRSGMMADSHDLLPVEALVRILYNPNLDDLWFVIPGMVAMILQTQSITMTADAVVREREVGTIEQILVTPIRPLELMLGKIAPNILITMVNMLTIVGLGVFWFGVPFRGDFWLFLWLCFMYVFSGLGLGLLISTISQTQKQALQLIVAMMLLGTILGGFVFPRYTMPPALRLIGNFFPLTYFIPISRAIITKGVGMAFLGEQVAALFIYVMVVMLAAARAFRQGLD